jgi:hypothetical protein
VLFSSHILSDAELLCSRVGILAKGKLVAAGSLTELTAGASRGWEVVAEGVTDVLAQRLRARVVRVTPISDQRYSFDLGGADRPEPFIAELAAAAPCSSPPRPSERRSRTCSWSGAVTGRRVGLVAWHVFKESVRDRVLYAIAAFAGLLVLGSVLIGQITAGQDLKIIKDLGLATIEIAGALMTIFIGVGLVSREIDRRSIFALLAKPLPRWEFIVGKYLGLVLTIAVNLWAMAAALYLVLAWQT